MGVFTCCGPNKKSVICRSTDRRIRSTEAQWCVSYELHPSRQRMWEHLMRGLQLLQDTNLSTTHKQTSLKPGVSSIYIILSLILHQWFNKKQLLFILVIFRFCYTFIRWHSDLFCVFITCASVCLIKILRLED